MQVNLTKLRKAKKEDIAAIHKLLNSERYLKATKKDFFPKRWIEAHINSPDSFIFVCEIGGKVAGVLLGDIWLKRRVAFERCVVVKSAFRKRKVAAGLFKYFENFAWRKGIRYVYGMASPSNRKIQKFLRRRGFKKGYKLIFYGKALKKPVK